MQKVIVYGGAGRTGSLVVKEALNKGYEVTVFSYGQPAPGILPESPNLKIVTGNAYVFEDVKNAMQGHDVVINIVAPKLFDSKNYPISEIATKNIITAMQELNIKRYIGQAGAWATDQLSDASWLMRLGFIFFLPLRNLYSYKKKEDTIVKSSNLDWTLVRCALLSDKPEPSEYSVHIDGYKCKPLELPKIRRINVADFEVNIINDSSYYQKCPVILE